MAEKILLIPAVIIGAQMGYVYLFKSYKRKKDARNELVMRAFIGFIVGIIIYGIISGMG